MSTHNPDEVPPVPTPPADSAAEQVTAPEPTPEVPASDAPVAGAVPSASPYGPAGTASDATAAAQPAQPYGVPQQPVSPPQTPYGAGQQPYGGYSATPALPKGLSITAMVTGIVGVVLGFAGWGFLLAVAGIIFGHIGQRREPHAKPFWLTGLITGYVGLALNLIVGLAILAAIFLPLLFLGTGSY